LKDKRPKLGEEEQVSESHCNKQSFEKKYSSKKSEEVVTDSEEEQVEDEGNDISQGCTSLDQEGSQAHQKTSI
jgi:hypothetical protein